MGKFAKANAAQHEFSIDRAGSPAILAARVHPNLEFRPARLLNPQTFLSHLLLQYTADSLTKRQTELLQQGSALLVGLSRGHKRDIHTPNSIEFVDHNFRKYDLLLQS